MIGAALFQWRWGRTSQRQIRGVAGLLALASLAGCQSTPAQNPNHVPRPSPVAFQSLGRCSDDPAAAALTAVRRMKGFGAPGTETPDGRDFVKTTSDARRVREVVRVLCSLPPDPSVNYDCPAYFGPEYLLTFRDQRGADVLTSYVSSACGGIQVGVDGDHKLATAELWRALGAALMIPASQKFPF